MSMYKGKIKNNVVAEKSILQEALCMVSLVVLGGITVILSFFVMG